MNEEMFSGKADNYDRYRPSYPQKLIDYLFDVTLADSVADIGAGTGKFTECLAKKPWDIIAVEPNEDMLQKLRNNVPSVKIIRAPAENTGIADHSVDLVTTAQAFHWFDAEGFKAECKRILTKRGQLAIVWNEREKCGLSAERDRVCMKYCGMSCRGEVGNRETAEGCRFLREEYFHSYERYSAENIVPMDEERFLGDMLSRSYSLSEDDEGYPQFISELKNVFARFEKNGQVLVPYRTICYLGDF
ncbi:MAG: class I SAM-dependent methyltransferase [Oscillospiraceae bacterium]